jgi:hypothetical protein
MSSRQEGPADLRGKPFRSPQFAGCATDCQGGGAQHTVAMAGRSYGTGSVYVVRDARGRETWYGRWRSPRRRKGQPEARAPGGSRYPRAGRNQ